MSELRETTDTAPDVREPQPTAPAETADPPRAETMSREEYADHMRREPAEQGDLASGSGETTAAEYSPDGSAEAQGMSREDYADHIRDQPPDNPDNGTGPMDAGGTADGPLTEPGESAQGMSREEYADYMRQGPTVEQSQPDALASAGEASAERGVDAVREPARSAPDSAGTARDAATPRGEDPYAEVTEVTTAPEDRTLGDTAPENRATDQIGAQASVPEYPDRGEPSPEEQTRLHALYQDYLKEQQAAADPGWDQGANVVGGKPDRSPSDTSDLPPTGTELLEAESNKRSRFSELFHEVEKEENLDGLHDQFEDYGNTVQKWLDAPPPETHAEQPVPASPYVTPYHAEHGIEGGSTVSAVMVTGIVTVHLVRWIHDKVTHRKGNRYAGNR